MENAIQPKTPCLGKYIFSVYEEWRCYPNKTFSVGDGGLLRGVGILSYPPG
jgi:hypothetical protein